MIDVHTAMLEYSKRGWSVIPLQPQAKEPMGNFALEPYMVKRAVGKFEIDQWVLRWPDLNVGVCTGPISGFFVVDCDTIEAYEAVVAKGIPDTLTVRTANGYHIYFEYPAFRVGHAYKRLREALHGAKVDVRGEKGYVVAPPSIHPSGVRYEWANDYPIAQAPQWIWETLRETSKAPMNGNGHETPVVVHNPAGYAAATLEKETRAITSAPEGDRNIALNASAYNVGQIVGTSLLSKMVAESALIDAAAAAGLPVDEAKKTVRSGLESGIANPRKVEVATSEKEQKPDSSSNTTSAASQEKPETEFRLTDLGNAKRLVRRWGKRLRYVAEWGKWLIWDDSRWAIDNTGGVMRAAKDTIINMYKEAPDMPDSTRADFVKWAIGSESQKRLESMISLSKSEKAISAKPDGFDVNHWLLNCQNVTVDLRSFKVRAHDPNDMLTRRIEVQYDPNAKCQTWRKFLNRCMGGNEELIDFIQRAIGYTLTGETSEQCLFFMIGTGRNGKSTFVETLLALLGAYAVKTPTETLMKKDRTGGVSNDVARIVGKRMVVARETDENQSLAEAVVKDLTGGDKMIARFLFQEYFEFRPTHKLWMYGNHRPVVRGTDEGIWRRIKLIPFTVTIPLNERDPLLPVKLENELPGILNWAIEGCKRWQQSGLGEPAIISDAVKEYRVEMDILGEWLSDKLDVKPDGIVSATALYASYKMTMEESGERAIGQRMLGLRLKERGFTQYKGSGGTRMWRGLAIRENKSDLIPF